MTDDEGYDEGSWLASFGGWGRDYDDDDDDDDEENAKNEETWALLSPDLPPLDRLTTVPRLGRQWSTTDSTSPASDELRAAGSGGGSGVATMDRSVSEPAEAVRHASSECVVLPTAATIQSCSSSASSFSASSAAAEGGSSTTIAEGDLDRCSRYLRFVLSAHFAREAAGSGSGSASTSSSSSSSLGTAPPAAVDFVAVGSAALPDEMGRVLSTRRASGVFSTELRGVGSPADIRYCGAALRR